MGNQLYAIKLIYQQHTIFFVLQVQTFKEPQPGLILVYVTQFLQEHLDLKFWAHQLEEY